jgi:hypothetical protein
VLAVAIVFSLYIRPVGAWLSTRVSRTPAAVEKLSDWSGGWFQAIFARARKSHNEKQEPSPVENKFPVNLVEKRSKALA